MSLLAQRTRQEFDDLPGGIGMERRLERTGLSNCRIAGYRRLGEGGSASGASRASRILPQQRTQGHKANSCGTSATLRILGTYVHMGRKRIGDAVDEAAHAILDGDAAKLIVEGGSQQGDQADVAFAVDADRLPGDFRPRGKIPGCGDDVPRLLAQ